MSEGKDLIVRLFGAMLMAVGGLIVVLCGLCSAAFLVNVLTSASQYGNSAGALSTILFILPIGGVPILIGVGIFFWGRVLFRRDRRE
jgi:hypothetical protein